MVLSCNRWLGIRLDLLSAAFVTIVAFAAILITENPGESVQTYLSMHLVNHEIFNIWGNHR